MPAPFPATALDWERFDLRLEHPAQVTLEAISGKTNVLSFSPGRWAASAVANIAPDWTGTELAAAQAIEAWLSSLQGAAFPAAIALPSHRFESIPADLSLTDSLAGAETVYTVADATGLKVGTFGRATIGGAPRLFQIVTIAGTSITLAPDVPITTPGTLVASASCTMRLAKDTPDYLGDPQFLGPWTLELVEAT